MKTKFQNALIKMMIERRDFMPVLDEEGNLRISEYGSILAKNTSGGMVIIEFLDGDRLTPEEIGGLLIRNKNILSNINSAGDQSFFEVFIFNEEPEAEKQEALMSGEMHDVGGKRYMKCLSVNLESGGLKKHFENYIDDAGLTKAIKGLIEGGVKEEIGIQEVKDIISRRQKEYEFSFKTDKPVVTYALIAINIAVFAVYYLYSMKTGKSYDSLIYNYGAKVNSKILEGQYFRFLTPVFLHAGLTHLLINSYSLFAVGVSVERIFGRFKFLIIYFTAGILGNVASFMFSTAWGIGASGAIFGLLGALLYFGLERPALFRRFFGNNLLIILAVNLAYGFSTSGIDNFAHIGGLIGGFLASGVIARPENKKWFFNRYLYIAVTLIFIILGLAYGFNNSQNRIIVKMNSLEGYYNSGNWKDAAATAKEILDLKPDTHTKAAVLSALARAEALTDNYDEAVKYAKLLVPMDPAEGHYLLGVFYNYMGKLDLAKQELLEAKRLGVKDSILDKLLKELK